MSIFPRRKNTATPPPASPGDAFLRSFADPLDVTDADLEHAKFLDNSCADFTPGALWLHAQGKPAEWTDRQREYAAVVDRECPPAWMAF